MGTVNNVSPSFPSTYNTLSAPALSAIRGPNFEGHGEAREIMLREQYTLYSRPQSSLLSHTSPSGARKDTKSESKGRTLGRASYATTKTSTPFSNEYHATHTHTCSNIKRRYSRFVSIDATVDITFGYVYN